MFVKYSRQNQSFIFVDQYCYMKYVIILSICFFAFTGLAHAQAEGAAKNEIENVIMVFPAVSFQFPAGDMSERFGSNSTIGMGYQHKTGGNWLFMADYNYIFGNKINQEGLIQNLLTVDGFVIGDNGQIAEVSFFERGFYTTLRAGKLIPLTASDPNSGLMLLAGTGFMQHKIFIKVKDNMVAALRKDYNKGYDRMTNGFSAVQFIGYMRMDKKRLHNFFAGIEIVEGWTKGRRSINFDTMTIDDNQRLDILYGIKLGWIIPFRKRMAKDYYYY